jgi:hypothetical protein
MHSALVRGQNVFGFFTTVVSFVAGFIALSVLVTPPAPSATLALRNVQMYVRSPPPPLSVGAREMRVERIARRDGR